MLWHGADDEPDEQEAVKWWLKAATMGYRPAQVDLAYAYVLFLGCWWYAQVCQVTKWATA